MHLLWVIIVAILVCERDDYIIMSTTARLADTNSINLASLILPCSGESLKPARPAWLAKHRKASTVTSDSAAINRTVGKTPPSTFVDLESEDLKSAVATSKAQVTRKPRRKSNKPKKNNKKAKKTAKKAIRKKKK